MYNAYTMTITNWWSLLLINYLYYFLVVGDLDVRGKNPRENTEHPRCLDESSNFLQGLLDVCLYLSHLNMNGSPIGSIVSGAAVVSQTQNHHDSPSHRLFTNVIWRRRCSIPIFLFSILYKLYLCFIIKPYILIVSECHKNKDLTSAGLIKRLHAPEWRNHFGFSSYLT